MQTKQTVNEGLKRAYLITIPAADLSAKIDAEIKKVAPQVRMPGFRPGKVPTNLVKKMHGEALHGQVVNDTIRESVDQLLRNEALRPAMQPEIVLNEDYEQGKDAQISVSLEVLPTIDTPSTDGLTLEKLVVPVTDAQIDEALAGIAGQNKSYKDAAKTKKAADGDQLIIDFVGKLDGVEFDGGKAEDAALVLGSGTFIPGFEDQLVGVKTGQEKTITVTFPAEYQAGHLAGKEATFDITVKAVKVETETQIDEDFAKNLGLDSLEKLKEIMKAQLEQQTAGLTRTQMKRALLDQLAAGHSFEVPATMVEAEFAQIWAQLQQEAANDEDAAAALKQIEDEKDEYKAIAERRVRLGLLLSEIGQANGVEVTQQEMGMLIQQAAAQYRNEDRERFIQYIQSEPMAAAQLRAPLYEDKVVDFLFDKAEVTEREVTVEELQAAIEAEETAPAPAPKKAAAKKKAPAKQAEAPAEDKPVAKKAPAKKAEAQAQAQAKPAAKTAPATKAAAAEKPAAKKAPAKKPATKK
ncbi:MAG: trigger factor [Alphaproteobacteria bacterium HGW-Alphaproteobacteria-14]|nr:MAG: trigger factor [Alphaproteobacteria bacterium HGW-Alphaproteobacteria-14]